MSILPQFFSDDADATCRCICPRPSAYFSTKSGMAYCPASTSSAPLGTWNWNSLPSRVGSIFS